MSGPVAAGRAAACALSLFAARASGASPLEPLLPPWAPFDLPSEARSVRVLRGEQAVFSVPNASAPRRGTTLEGATLPLFGAQMGPGCRAPWFHVATNGWLCGDEAELSASAPVGARASEPGPDDDGLPFRYYFAGSGGARAYRNLVDFDVTEPAFELDPGFAVAIVGERVLLGERYGLTRRGLWVRLSEFGPADPSLFRGVRLGELGTEVIPYAWVVSARAPIYTRRGAAFSMTGASKVRLERVDWLEEVRQFASTFVRIGDDEWLRAVDLRHPSLAAPPEGVDAESGEHWIDVELATQTIVAYEGAKPVFASLVSTGRGKPGSPLGTPLGTHRIWVKLLGTTMDNLEDANASRYYRIEDVPHVQFFSKGVGLHAAFWHRSFGHVRSHGCVNLSPRDAAFLFRFTEPRLPAGWSAVLPSPQAAGTIVRVR